VGSYALACRAIAFGAPPDPSRAREATLALTACARHIPKPMAGSPLKRQRKLGVRADDGSVIAFPYLPRAGLSHAEWRALGPGEKQLSHVRSTTRMLILMMLPQRLPDVCAAGGS
jgi:hypothetical protein